MSKKKILKRERTMFTNQRELVSEQTRKESKQTREISEQTRKKYIYAILWEKEKLVKKSRKK